MPVAGPGAGNIFDPTAGQPIDDAQPPRLGQIASGPMPGQTQSPEQQASLTQSWKDWFHNPSTASFLMQFGASMLQPNPRGFGAQLGQSVGEGGQAVLRGQEAQQAQKEAEAKTAYTMAEAKAQPTLAEAKAETAAARQTAAEAAESRARSYEEIGQQRAAYETQLAYIQGQYRQTQEGQMQLRLDHPGYDAWLASYKDWQQAKLTGMLADPNQPPPDLSTFDAQFRKPGTAGTAPAGGGPPPVPLSKLRSDPKFQAWASTATPAQIAQYGAPYIRSGVITAEDWQAEVANAKAAAQKSQPKPKATVAAPTVPGPAPRGRGGIAPTTVEQQ